MDFDPLWTELRDRCASLGPDEVLVTPASDAAFRVVATREDRIAVEFVDDGERSLRRPQFEVLADRLASDPRGVSTADLPTGVEPYVAVLSLASRYLVDDEALRRAAEGEGADGGESPFRRPAWTARSRPERVRDDAVLLANAIDHHDVGDDADVSELDPDALVDLYVLLSDVQRGADRFRQAVGDPLLAYVGPDAQRHGTYGTVRRTTRERRLLKDDETVLAALDDADVPREWVLGVDREKLDVVLAATDLEASDVYNVEEQVYVQKTGVDEAEKQSRLQGLRERLADLESDEAADLRADIDDLEDRIDAVLAAAD